MPVDKQKILRFQVLNKCFRNRHRDYTIDDLVTECNKVVDKKLDKAGISKRTIQNDIAELEMPPYNIDLDDRLRIGHKRIYRYKDTNFSINLFHLSDSERERIESAINVLEYYDGAPQYAWVKFCLQRIVSDNFSNGFSSFISFQNNPDLYGIEHFEVILKSIANKQPLKITYRPYPKKVNGQLVERNENVVRVFPYHLKQYNDRWFLIGRQQSFEQISNYALDRIKKIECLHIPFEESEVNFEDFYDDVVGVSISENVEEILLKVSRERYPYIQTKPIHWTQTEIKELSSEDYSTIRIKVAINNELITQIMSYAEDIEVLEPLHLRVLIANKISHMQSLYKQ